MESSKILTADLDDIIFENRNKNYGAYFLRKIYNRHIMVAGMTTLAAFIIAFSIPYIKALLHKDVVVKKPVTTVTELSAPPPLDKTEPPPPPPDLPPPPPKTIKFTPPVIKPDEQVPPDQEPPPVEELKEAEPAATTVDPNANVDFSAAPPEQQVVEEKKPEIFMYVEQMPEFPGGVQELQKYLSKNIRYPAAARENGIEGKVVLQFVVNESGNISDIQVVRDIGGGCADEAIRVVKNMPPWKAGKQNGNPVKVYFKLPVTFKLGTE
ncbi:MAG: energy transducer TonB [Chitinophagales bacterium]|nr:energy transducer TonB [Chitinophagales bacterium]